MTENDFSHQQHLDVVRALFRLYTEDESTLDVDLERLKSASLEIINRNKLIALYRYAMEKYELLPALGKKNFRMLDLMCCYEKNLRAKRESHNRILFRRMKEEKINFAVRKGESLSFCYKESHHRISGDTDILIDKNDKNKIVEILDSLGYKMGEFDHFRGEIKDYRREELIKYNISPDHLPHYLLVDDGYPVSVDIAYSITWFKDNESYSTTELIDSSTSELNAEAKFLDTTLHLYRETFLKSSLLNRAPYLSGMFDSVILHNKKNTEIEDNRVKEIVWFSLQTLAGNESYECLNRKYAYYYSGSEKKPMKNSVLFYMFKNRETSIIL
ncbi:nucleotidyltransferase family protein [Erwinia mallotivora]|uniref:Nucleotidyltransferase n=1 Tax=Erwinia mallotivora TaxID=69222 RepID=A0A014PZ95_9GAMM|nr:nucleotidyltransferase family protein [Erwinia mallotivora]EXU76287.1 hypothetical protein BG55_06230 [Erwinia mallotivora]